MLCHVLVGIAIYADKWYLQNYVCYESGHWWIMTSGQMLEKRQKTLRLEYLIKHFKDILNR